MGGEVEKMIMVGVIWGTTNALMKRGALLCGPTATASRLSLLLTWQYTVPFLLNLSASAAFFSLLHASSISLAVPVTNAVTFASTAVVGSVLGEDTRAGTAALGTLLILTGVSICIA